MIYLVMFSTSSFLFWIAEHTRKKIKRKWLVILAVLLPAILAGCRADNIGTDVLVYGRGFYYVAANYNNFIDYYSRFVYSILSDPGYYLLNYVVSLYLLCI